MRINIKVHKKSTSHTQRPLLTFIGFTLILFFILSFLPKEKPEISIIEEESIHSEPEIPALIVHEETIRQGSTLSDILSAFTFTPQDIHTMREDVKSVYDPARIKAGHKLRLNLTETEEFVSLEYDIDEETYLLIHKKETKYEAEIKPFPFETRTAMACGVIDDILITAVLDSGEEAILAMLLAEIFAWDIDFHTDLRKGDSFKVIFEKKYLEDEFKGYKNILAAEFTNQGKTFQAFRYIYPDTGEIDYFNYSGDSLRKEFLKSPIKFGSRITSRFSFSRLHPIRKVYRPHLGVDYGARIGTPVQATAEGQVTFAGWNGGAGHMVRIRHKKGYETMYLHLGKIYVKKGSRVQGGQVIGTVGSSGESTGPHLDYRIRHYGRHINPLAARFDPAKPLRPEFLEDFQKKAGFYRTALDAPQLIISSFLD